jgi:hypothetical protein
MLQGFSYVSDIGGMVGLWIGLSSLSFVQILEFVAETMKDMIHKLHNKKCPRSIPDNQPTRDCTASPSTQSAQTDVDLAVPGNMTPVDI